MTLTDDTDILFDCQIKKKKKNIRKKTKDGRICELESISVLDV